MMFTETGEASRYEMRRRLGMGDSVDFQPFALLLSFYPLGGLLRSRVCLFKVSERGFLILCLHIQMGSSLLSRCLQSHFLLHSIRFYPFLLFLFP